MCLKHVILPTEEVFIAHEDTYGRLAAAGVHPFAVIGYVLQQIVGPDTPNFLELAKNDTHELGQGVLEYLAENLGVDISKMDYELYEGMCRAVNDLYATLMRVRDTIFSLAGPGEFISSITQGKFYGGDMTVTVDVVDMRG